MKFRIAGVKTFEIGHMGRSYPQFGGDTRSTLVAGMIYCRDIRRLCLEFEFRRLINCVKCVNKVARIVAAAPQFTRNTQLAHIFP